MACSAQNRSRTEAILEGRTQAESISSALDLTAFFPDDGAVAPTRPLRPSLRASKEVWVTEASPRHPPPEAPRMEGPTRHMLRSLGHPLLALQTSASANSKARPCRETHDPTRPPPVSCHRSCPNSVLPRVPRRPPPLCPTDADLCQELPRWNHPITQDSWLRQGTGLHQKRRSRRQRPCFPLPAAFLLRAAAHPPFATASGLSITTLTIPT